MALKETVFLVEHYAPGSGVEQLQQVAENMRAAGQERVRLIQATIVPTDESLLCLVAAPSRSHVRRTCKQAGVVPDRISVAVTADVLGAPVETRPKGEAHGT